MDVGGRESVGALRSPVLARLVVAEGSEKTHVAKQLDTVLDSVHAARLEELLQRDGLAWVNQASVDPVLQAIQIQRRHLLPQTA